MHTFTYENATVKFEIANGVVVSCKNLNEPRKYVEGQYWVRRSDGYEQMLYLGARELNLRLGQKVSLAYASSAVSKYSFVVFVRNQNLSQTCFIEDGASLNEKLIEPLSKGKPLLASALLSCAAAFFVGTYGLAAGWLLYHILRTEQVKREKLLISELETCIQNLDKRLNARRTIDNALARSA